jgi:3-oxoacyl-[acyl-carrier-protein] synthase-3
MEAYIKAVACQMGSHEVTNADIVRDFPDWSEQKISVKIGIDKRYVAGEETASDLAFKAAKKLIVQESIDKTSIDAIILCTQSPDYFLPTTACVLQDRLGLRTDVMAFDYNLGCSGYVYGLGICKSFIVAGLAKNILLLTAETYNRYIDKSDRGNRALFSDAGTATLISAERGLFKIGAPVYGTDGSGYTNLIVKGGGARNPDEKAGNLFMDGPTIFNFTLEAVPPLVQETLKRNSLEFDDVSCFIFHQANKHMLKFIREAIHIPEDKFYLCLQNYGNTVSSTIPICLDNFVQDGRVKSGDKYLLAGFGVGYSWGAITLEA